MRPRLYYGWVIVTICLLANLFTIGIGGTSLGVFLRPMKEALGWNFTQLSLAVTIQGALGMAVGPIVGPLLDRYGARPLMAVGAIVAVGGLLLMSGVQDLWQFYVLYAIVGALGLSEVGHIATDVVISKWFVRKLGRAMAITSAGGSLGVILVAPLTALLIGALGWRDAWFALGAILMVFLAVPVILWVRSTPESMGVLPDGDASPQQETAPATKAGNVEQGHSVREALATPSFWILLVVNNLGGLMAGTTAFHQINYLQDRGLSASGAGVIYSVGYAVGLPSRVFFGYALERFPSRYSFAATLLARSLGLLGLVALPLPLGIAAFMATYGVVGGSYGLITSYMWTDYYGRRSIGAIRGLIRLLSVSGLAAAVFAAFVRDVTGSYDRAFLALAALGLLSTALVLLAKRPAPVAASSGSQTPRV